jgi:hypothetical protein
MGTKVRKNLEIKKLIATFAETKAKRNSMNENEKQERLQIELPQNVAQGEYANFAIITHGSSDFVVDFARVLPGVSKAQVCSRIILAPEHAKRLLGALQENVMRYEREFGTIKIPNQEPRTIAPFDIPGGEA